MSLETYENFFNSSARSAGSRLYKEAKVSFAKPSALEITSYVKPNYRVNLKLDSLQSKNINVACNCPPSQKGQLCKHIWAAFLVVHEKSPDFLAFAKEVTKKAPTEKIAMPQSEAQILLKENFKLKQEIYRKEQYQKQKLRAKEFKKNKKTSSRSLTTHSEEVTKALSYFAKNGFILEDSLDEGSVFLARKKLSRIFHPDAGGSHDESLELNNNSEILLKYINKI